MLHNPDVTKIFLVLQGHGACRNGGIVRDLIDAGHIDVLALDRREPLPTTLLRQLAAVITTVMRDVRDVELRHEEINRIYDVYLPNDAFYQIGKEFMQGIYSELPGGTTFQSTG